MNQWLAVLKQAGSAWIRDSAPSKGAALAYYATFSIAPMLFIAMALAGLIFGEEAVTGAVFAQLSDLMGPQGAEAIQEMVSNLEEPSTGIWSTVIGVILLLIGASTVFGQLQTALDEIWEVPGGLAQRSGMWDFVRGRLLSFGMVLAMGFLVSVSLLLSTAVAAMGKWWGPYFGETLGYFADLGVSFVLLTLVFAMIYKFVPRARIEWRDVWVGAAVTAALFTVGKWAIGLYLGKSDVASSFGAFGSLVIVMVWVYYSAQIFLLGAEFTWAYAQNFGSRNMQEAANDPEVPVLEDEIPAKVSFQRNSLVNPKRGGLLVAAFGAGLLLRAALRQVHWRSVKRHIFG